MEFPKKTFSKDASETETESLLTESSNKNLNDMSDGNEFYNVVGNESEVTQKAVTPPPIVEKQIKV